MTTIKDRFDSWTFADIAAMVDAHEPERLDLEFKRLAGTAKFEHVDDRKNLAEALSGFANSAGGVIVWGVHAAKNEDGIDAAIKPEPVKGLRLLESRLSELSTQLVTPPLPEVEHRALLRAVGEDVGFALSYVPQSDGGPHMAKAKGVHWYMKRAGASFYKLEHFDLEDMFGRRPRPALEVVARVKLQWRTAALVRACVIVGLRSRGRGSARAPYIAVGRGPECLAIDPLGDSPLRDLGRLGSEFHHFGGGTETTLHPGVEVDIARLGQFDLPTEHRGNLKFPCRLAADGLPLHEVEVEVSASAFAEVVR